jgi:DNA-binding FadR family transcriptional regulator
MLGLGSDSIRTDTALRRAIRTLDEKTLAMIRAGADVYVRRFKHYAKALKRIG